MRILSLALSSVLLVMLLSPAVTAAQRSGSSEVIQVWYTSGTNIVGGAQVWAYAGTNLTMNATFSSKGGNTTEEITEFHVFAVVPGKDAYPLANGTNTYPFPQVTAFYDTSQIVRNASECVRANNSVGFVCNVPHVNWEHQVIEVRFIRLVEFLDANGNGGYDQGETEVSRLGLGDRSLHYALPALRGLNKNLGPADLPFRLNSSAVYGNSSAGWLGQSDAGFKNVRGLAFDLSASGALSFDITGYQWLAPFAFQGQNMTPGRIKIDLSIGSYAFQNANSRLALEVNVKSFSVGSATNWSVEPWSGGQALGIDSVNTTAVFAWSSTAMADGASSPVVSTISTVDHLTRTVYLGYPHAQSIRHDPIVGIEDKRVLGTQATVGPGLFLASPTWIAFLATLACSVIAIYLIERRKR